MMNRTVMLASACSLFLLGAGGLVAEDAQKNPDAPWLEKGDVVYLSVDLVTLRSGLSLFIGQTASARLDACRAITVKTVRSNGSFTGIDDGSGHWNFRVVTQSGRGYGARLPKDDKEPSLGSWSPVMFRDTGACLEAAKAGEYRAVAATQAWMELRKSGEKAKGGKP